MIVLDIPQHLEDGSANPEWLSARRGIPTASAADKILTPAKIQPSSQRGAYLNTLLAEWATGESADDFEGTVWTERGLQMEDEARSYFEFTTGNTVDQVGFCYHDESRMAGCSPDGLIDDAAIFEMKCPKPATHVGYLLAGTLPTKYIAQAQFSLWATGRNICWWQSFCPGLPALLLKVERDPKWTAALNEHIPAFIADLLAGRERLREMGVAE